jgi:hypothetical protein
MHVQIKLLYIEIGLPSEFFFPSTMCTLPNEDDPRFVKKILNLILEKGSGLLLMGETLIMSQTVDRSPVPSTQSSRMCKSLTSHCLEVGLVDVWRYLYPSERGSNHHLSCSRIDNVFTTQSKANRIMDCEILPITLVGPFTINSNVGFRTKICLTKMETKRVPP